jgi:hypothetical protein
MVLLTTVIETIMKDRLCDANIIFIKYDNIKIEKKGGIISGHDILN